MDSNSNYWRYVAALLIPGCIMTLLFQRKETFITYNLNRSRKLESQDLQFTVVRKGYDPTSFFGETTTLSDILKYRILKGFVGVIEPQTAILAKSMECEYMADQHLGRYKPLGGRTGSPTHQASYIHSTFQSEDPKE